MAVAWAGPYANLHLDPDTQQCQHPTTQFFTGRMPFLPPNQQRQSTEGNFDGRQFFWIFRFQKVVQQRNLGKMKSQWPKVEFMFFEDMVHMHNEYR